MRLVGMWVAPRKYHAPIADRRPPEGPATSRYNDIATPPGRHAAPRAARGRAVHGDVCERTHCMVFLDAAVAHDPVSVDRRREAPDESEPTRRRSGGVPSAEMSGARRANRRGRSGGVPSAEMSGAGRANRRRRSGGVPSAEMSGAGRERSEAEEGRPQGKALLRQPSVAKRRRLTKKRESCDSRLLAPTPGLEPRTL